MLVADSSFKFQLTKLLSTSSSNLLSHAVITTISILDTWSCDNQGPKNVFFLWNLKLTEWASSWRHQLCRFKGIWRIVLGLYVSFNGGLFTLINGGSAKWLHLWSVKKVFRSWFIRAIIRVWFNSPKNGNFYDDNENFIFSQLTEQILIWTFFTKMIKMMSF